MGPRSRRGAGHKPCIASAVLIAACPLCLTPVASAQAFTFNQPFVRQAGPEAMIFDWTTQRCEDNDITDESARAFRDDAGTVNLITTHFVNRRFIGPNLDNLSHPCAKLFNSGGNSN